jgi:hypothetical protein
MSNVSAITLLPIYGWGWRLPGEIGQRVPLPFVMRIKHFKNSEWHGCVESPGHEFDGAALFIWQRGHLPEGSYVNVHIGAEDGNGDAAIFGYAIVKDIDILESTRNA